MNTEIMFSSKTDMWATPQDFFDMLDSEFGFTLDACAVRENAKCAAYYTPQQDGLSQPCPGRVWCNPPYGREIGRWVKKASRYRVLEYCRRCAENGRCKARCLQEYRKLEGGKPK